MINQLFMSEINWLDFVYALESRVLASLKKGKGLALFIVDIDSFNYHNLNSGYLQGERIIEESFIQLEKNVNYLSYIGRISPHQIALIVEGVNASDFLSLGADKIIKTMSSIEEIIGDHLQLDIYLGVASLPDHGDSAEKLISSAVYSLKRAKENGVPYYIDSGSEGVAAVDTWQLANELKSVLADEGVFLNYQPKLDLTANRVSSAEALMRWQRKDGQQVSPTLFIPVAEKYGIIGDLTDWLIHTALREISQLSCDYPDFSVAVNLSASSIYDPSVSSSIQTALEIWNVNPERLVIEVTESILIEDPGLCFKNLCLLRDMGVRIAIDDFGTGYSSLSYFKNIPANELKIDQSFVRSMIESSGDAKIVEMIIQLSHKFGLKVVAEGVENAQVMAMVADMGCDYIQGYHISKPLPFDDLSTFLKNA